MGEGGGEASRIERESHWMAGPLLLAPPEITAGAPGTPSQEYPCPAWSHSICCTADLARWPGPSTQVGSPNHRCWVRRPVGASKL